MLQGPQVEGVTRAQICEALTVLGIDPSAVRSVHIRQACVTVELLVRGPDGKKVAAGNEVATATTMVPVIDDRFDREEPVHPITVTTATVA